MEPVKTEQTNAPDTAAVAVEEFEKTITQIGSSKGVIIPSHLLKYHNLKKGDEIRVKIEIEKGPSFNSLECHNQQNRFLYSMHAGGFNT